MPVRQLKEFLDNHEIKYVTINHSRAYTAQEVAASAHVPGDTLAKTVMIKIDGRMGMAVVPAPQMVHMKQLGDAIGANNVELASEQDFKEKFPECDLGAMPPFGNLYGMDVFVEEDLTKHKEIVFNAGSHTELIRLSFEDFKRLVEPRILGF